MACVTHRQRLDKWLWYARSYGTRSLAAKRVGAGRVRVNGRHAKKPAQKVVPGDILTIGAGGRIRVIRIIALANRRGSAANAQMLYVGFDVQ